MAGTDRPMFTVAEIEAALRSLPDDERTVFVARGIDKRSYAEIAGSLGITVADVEPLFARALVHWDDALARIEQERRDSP